MLPELHPDSTAPIWRIGYFNTSRYCWMGCAFCDFAKPLPNVALAEVPPGLNLDLVNQALDFGAVDRLKLHGGLSMREPFDYWIHLIRQIKGRTLKPLTAFSPVEIWQYHVREHRSLRDLLGLLKWAGADALGPGGSETFDVELRRAWSPYRMTPDQWLQVAEAAEQTGLPYHVGLMVMPRMPLAAVEAHLSALRHLRPAAWELKPFRSEKTALAVQGDAHLLEIADVVEHVRHSLSEAVIHVRLDAPRPDAAQILHAAGASAMLVPVWEVSP